MIKLMATAVLSYIFIRLLIANAGKLHLLDIPNGRSFHYSITPLGGGIGFMMSFFFSILAFKFYMFLEYWYIFTAIFIVFLGGLADDRYHLSAKMKFLIIFVAVFVLWLNHACIYTLGQYFDYQFNLVWWFVFPFSAFAIAGFTNALNLIDGIDGLAGSISIVIIAFFGLIGYDNGNTLMITISTFTIASLVGFMILNWNPAKVFMGDSGSLSLGFIISVLAVLSIKYIPPVVVLYLAAVPILDTLVVMIRRIKKRKSPFKPDKTHLHHIMVKFFNMNVKKTVIFLVILQIIFSSTGYVMLETMKKDSIGIAQLLALIGFVMMFFLFYMIFTNIKRRQLILDKEEE